jgi:hypothetical protein
MRVEPTVLGSGLLPNQVRGNLEEMPACEQAGAASGQTAAPGEGGAEAGSE